MGNHTLLPQDMSEKSSLLPTMNFHVREATGADAHTITALDRCAIDNSISATRDRAVSPSDLEKGLQRRTPNTFHLVADTDFKQYSVNAARPDAETRDRDTSSPLLGYVAVQPYTGLVAGPRSCYGRTALLALVIAERAMANDDQSRAVISALVEQVFSRLRKEGSPYATVVASVPYLSDNHELCSLVDGLKTAGFRQVGLMKGVIEKKGLLLDQVFLQRSVHVCEDEKEHLDLI